MEQTARELEALNERLRDSEARLRQLADNLPAGFMYQVVVDDQGGRFTYVSGGVEAMLGVSPDAITADPMHLYGLIDPHDLPHMRAAEEVALRHLSPFDFRFRTRGRDGVLHWLHVRSAPRPRPGGGTVWDGVALDITERVLAEQRVHESEVRFRTIADSAPVLIWLNGLAGCEFVNRAYLDFLGATLDQARGMSWTDAVHPDDRAGYVAAYLSAFAIRARFGAQFRFRRADGEYRWFQSVGVPRFTPEGEFVGYTGVSADVTDMKAAEASLREADRRKDEFLAILGHELRNPLAPIRNAVEILKRLDGAPPEARSLYDMVERQVLTLTRLTDELLDVSRVVRGKAELKREEVDLATVIGRAVETTRPVLEERGLLLTVSPSREPLCLDADPVRLEQVLTNLLTNAAKYTDRNGLVRLESGREGGEAVVRVRDTGIGIRPEVLPRLFEPFQQADRVPGRGPEGLGIGLALVKGLVELHGGSVRASSEGPGRGSEFTVRLPLAAAVRGGGPAASPGRKRCGPPRRVLVVDDNIDAARSLALYLQMFGHDVCCVHDGPAALGAVAERRPEVVFLDIGMPGMDGYEVARRLRADGSRVRLVALTGYGQEEDRRRAFAAGFDEHLTKPADPEAIQAMLASG